MIFFSIVITKLCPSNSASLFLVSILVFQKSCKVNLQNLESSILSSSNKALLVFSMQTESLETDLLPNLRSYMSLLNIALIFGALLDLWVRFVQLEETA
jgi:hypothetical protein